MPEWRDEAIVVGVRAHGETSAILDTFTRHHGRTSGLVRGGRSRRIRPILQIGNLVEVVWKARLADHLGNSTVELKKAYAGEAMSSPRELAGLMSMAALVQLLPERDPHPALFEVTLFVLSLLNDEEIWPALYVRWELALLDELGVGLDLSQCAGGGSADDLAYVSPKSRRAVSREKGAAYAGRLLRLPRFLLPGGQREANVQDVSDGLALTGFFLERDVLGPNEKALPEPRARIAAA